MAVPEDFGFVADVPKTPEDFGFVADMPKTPEDFGFVADPVGVGETLRNVDIIDVLEHIPVPFNPYQGAEKAGYLEAKERLAEGQYEKYAQPKYEMTPMGGYTMVRPAIDQAQDLTYTKQFEDWEREKATRGVTWGQSVAHGILDILPWIADIAISGGARKATTTAIAKAIKSPKLATGAALLANALTASAMQPSRFAETAATVQIQDPELSKSEVYIKAIKRLYIENFSEMTGQHVTKLGVGALKRLPFGGKLIEKTGAGWRKMFNKSNKEFLEKISTTTGINDLFGEWGEERVNTVLQAIVDADDFGAGKDAGFLERIYAGLKQDAGNVGTEIPILAFPAGGRYVLSAALSKRQKASLRRELEESGLSKDQTKTVIKEVSQGKSLEEAFDVVSDIPAEVVEKPVTVTKLPKRLTTKQFRKRLISESDRILSEAKVDGVDRQKYIQDLTGKSLLKDLNDEQLITIKGTLEAEFDTAFDLAPVAEPTVGEPKTIVVMMQNVQKYGKEELQSMFEEWVKSPEGITEKGELNLPEGHKFEETALWEAFNRSLFRQEPTPTPTVTEPVPAVEELAAEVEPSSPKRLSDRIEQSEEVDIILADKMLAKEIDKKPEKHSQPASFAGKLRALLGNEVWDNMSATEGALLNEYLIAKIADRSVTLKSFLEKKIKQLTPPAKVTTADEAIGKQYGLTPEETNERLDKAELRYRELKNIPVNERTKFDKEELTFLKPKRNRKSIEALLDRDLAPAIAVPDKRPRRTLLALGHKIPKKLGMDDVERRDFMEGFTGKRSLKDLSRMELEIFIEVLENDFGTPKLAKEDFQKPIQVGNVGTTMAKVIDSAAEDVEALPVKRKIPGIISKKFARRRDRPWLGKLKDILWGEENTVLYALSEKLGPTFSDVVGLNIGMRSNSLKAGHAQTVFTAFQNAMKENGVTDTDLARMSKSQNPRFRFVQAIQEARGVGTEINTVEINGKKFEMTMGELIEFYLVVNQQDGLQQLEDVAEIDYVSDGLRHTRYGGCVINNVKTGAMSRDTIFALTQRVEADSKAMAIIEAYYEIGEDIWKPSINNVSQNMEGKDTATIKNWWGLEVYAPKRLGGKQEKFNMNLIENRSIFKDRTKSSRPVVIRDAFSRFAIFENAISEYVGFAESTRVARSLINDPRIATELDQKGYGSTLRRIATILDRAQSVPSDSGAFGKFLSEQIPHLYRAYIFFNPRVVALQTTSVGNYGAFVSPKYMLKTMQAVMKHPVDAVGKTLELSRIAWDRFYMGHGSLALGETAKSDAALRMFTHKSSDVNKLGWTLKISDMLALSDGREKAEQEYLDAQAGTITGESAIYWADKNVTHKGEWAKGEDGKWKATNKDWAREIQHRAEFLWQRSQPSWDKWNRSMMTSGGLLPKIFLPFRTFHEKSLTILQQANTVYDRSDKSISAKATVARKYSAVLSSYTAGTIIRAVMMGLVTLKMKRPWEYISDLLEAPLSVFPFLGSVLKNSLGNFINVLIDQKMEYHGEALEVFPATMLNLLAQVPVNFSVAIAHLIDGDIEKAKTEFKRALKKIYKGLGTSFGIPVSEMNRVYGGWIEGKEEPEPTAGKRGRRRVRPRGRVRKRMVE